jgi:hypothetical protein
MRSLLAVIALLTLGAVPSARAEEVPASDAEYSADFIMETAEGASNGRLNVAPGKERREDLLQDGDTMVSIRRDDLRRMWMLMPAERMYMEISMDQPAPPGTKRPPSPEEYETKMTREGSEELNGLVTTKYKVIMTGKDGSKMGGFWWMSDEGVLVKMDVISVIKGEKTRMKRELTNIQVGPQSPDLFEIPAGYTSMSMGLASGMLGLPSMGEAPTEGGEASQDAPTEQPKKKKKGFGADFLKDVVDAVKQ